MLFFHKRPTYESSGYFKGFTDYHCHILPGVDDGVQTMPQSLEILTEYERIGVSDVWCTPHIMEDIPNTTAALRQRFDELKAAYKGNIHLHLAAEYMMDGLFEERLEAGDLLTLGDEGDQILVETSYFNKPIHMEQTLRDIMSKGLFPVLAHPERYIYIADIKAYRELKQMGVRLQMNLGSIAEVYGKTAKRKALMLIKEDAYDYTGTDLHNIQLLHTILNTKKPN